MAAPRPVGDITRGTTHANRLRRLDGWLIHRMTAHLRHHPDALVVDLGFGEAPTTTLELADRLRARLDRAIRVVGIDIDPDRVERALPLTRDGVTFALGGFEVPLPGERRASVIRAANVLRQYDEAAVPMAWRQMTRRLDDGGLMVDCTCDELGRLGSWIAVGRDGMGDPVPRTLTLSLHLASLVPRGSAPRSGSASSAEAERAASRERGRGLGAPAELVRPSRVAERLPKVLIHRNVPGEPIHGLLCDLDRAWSVAAPLGVFGVRQRWIETIRALKATGWPVQDGPARWRLGELTVPWPAVAPR